MIESARCRGCGVPRDAHPAPTCPGLGGRGCGAPVTGETFNVAGGLVLVCEPCGRQSWSGYHPFRRIADQQASEAA